ncbi:rhodanese-like domain-containing protein [Pontibacillus salicampi]|uniref:Rhodanese-like domain-containing protein n=1 Tax=Pontibacillus salicampi TaxID=1449801 RepID=A0ABV6LIM9_9BACI
MQTAITIGMILIALFWISRTILPPKGVTTVSIEAAKHDLENNALSKHWVDVRTPSEFKRNHIKGFTNIPLQSLQQQANQLDPSKELILICQSGSRSMAAAKILKKLGYPHITNVKGGLNAWK